MSYGAQRGHEQVKRRSSRSRRRWVRKSMSRSKASCGGIPRDRQEILYEMRAIKRLVSFAKSTRYAYNTTFDSPRLYFARCLIRIQLSSSVFPACRIGAGFGDNNLQPTANLEQSSLANIATLSSPINTHMG